MADQIIQPPTYKFRHGAAEGITLSVDHPTDLSNAISYMDRQGDRDLLLQFTADRYATSIKRADEGTSSGTNEAYDTFVLGRVKAALDSYHYELIPAGTLGRIVDERATLFSHPKQKWTLTEETEKDDDGGDTNATDATPDATSGPQMVDDEPGRAEEITGLLEAHRTAGRFNDAVVRADRLSCAVNVAAVRVQWASGHLSYEAIRPTGIQIRYPLIVEEQFEGSGEASTRSPLYTDIEDAAAVAVQLRDASSAYGDALWQTYVGRCEEYPQGRCVAYRAREYWPVPDPGEGQIVDEWEWHGEPANPLTVLQDQYPGEVEFEYPVSIILGSDGGSDACILPASPSLYQRVIDAECAWTRNITSAVRGGQGTAVVKDPLNRGLPDTVEQAVALRTDQDLIFAGWPAGNAQAAAEVLSKVLETVAASEGVPGYLVATGDRAVPESAAALAIRHQPQLDNRARRIQLNHSAVMRLVMIEFYYLSLFTGRALSDFTELHVTWDPGQWSPPTPRGMKAEELQKAITAGLIDKVEAVRDYHDLDTREEAEALLAQYQESQGKLLDQSDPGVRAMQRIGVLNQQQPPQKPGQQEEGAQPEVRGSV